MRGLNFLAAIAARALRYFKGVRLGLSPRHAARAFDIASTPPAETTRYKTIIDVASARAKFGVWECDLRTDTLSWTDGVYALFDLPARSKITREEAVAFYHPESRARMEILRARAIEEQTSFSLDARITTSNGIERWMRLTADVECENGKPVRLFGVKQDITQERALVEQLRLLAETDLLTGLANRGQVQARFDARGEHDVTGALLLVDLDGFKRINDTLGHPAGDECLRQVATRLRGSFKPDTLIARLGGDEFAIVLEGAVSRREVEDLAVALLAELRRPFGWDGHVFALSGSIGITMSSAGHDAALPLIEADLALYAAKSAGRNTYRVFVPEMRASSEPRRSIEPQFELFDAVAERLMERTLIAA